jgi:palmitoyltransferase ZDHHC9/14/18
VGRRNYRFFMLFITSTTLLCVYVFASCALLLKRTRDDMEGGGVWDAVVEKPVAMILMVSTQLLGRLVCCRPGLALA